jgi:hypothetical protein
MPWTEIHVRVDGADAKSKKAVKDALKAGVVVTGETVSQFNDWQHEPLHNLTPGSYVFAGPNPYTNRRFYGQVLVDPDGKVTVK